MQNKVIYMQISGLLVDYFIDDLLKCVFIGCNE